jgi:hypothetical protein
LLCDHQYLVGARREALRATPVELADAWSGLVDRAHASLSEDGSQ